MALLRMIAVALVACSAAEAEPPAPPGRGAGARPATSKPAIASAARVGARPATWKPMPTIASAVGAAAKAEGVLIDAVDAWGEPAAGCYAVRLELHGGTADAAALADQVLAGLQRTGAPRAAAASAPTAAAGARKPAAASREAIAISDLVRPSGSDGVLAFAFASPPYRGGVRAHLGNGRIAAITCFGNQREPLACDAACAHVLEGGP